MPLSETNHRKSVSKTVASTPRGGVDTGADARALRPLQVLELLAQQHTGMSLSALAEQLALPKASAMRLLHALESQAYVMREPGSSAFRLGPRAAALGLSTLRAATVAHRYRPLLSALVARLGETCNLTARAGDHVVYIDRVETTEPLRMTLPPGSRVPLHCTASGKLFLSQMPVAQCQALLATLDCARKTAQTITQTEALLTEIAHTRKRGIGVDKEEFINGMVAIAVPVRDARGQCVAAVACHTPTARMSLADLLTHVPTIEHSARRIGALLLGPGALD